jgi:hypothetical protein
VAPGVPSLSLEVSELQHQHPLNNCNLEGGQNVDFAMDDGLDLGNGYDHGEISCPNILCPLITLPRFRGSHGS